MDDISPAPVDLPVANEVENVEINKILYGVIDRVHGLSAILISTGDGVPLVQVARDPESVSPADLAYFQVRKVLSSCTRVQACCEFIFRSHSCVYARDRHN